MVGHNVHNHLAPWDTGFTKLRKTNKQVNTQTNVFGNGRRRTDLRTILARTGWKRSSSTAATSKKEKKKGRSDKISRTHKITKKQNKTKKNTRLCLGNVWRYARIGREVPAQQRRVRLLAVRRFTRHRNTPCAPSCKVREVSLSLIDGAELVNTMRRGSEKV